MPFNVSKCRRHPLLSNFDSGNFPCFFSSLLSSLSRSLLLHTSFIAVSFLKCVAYVVCVQCTNQTKWNHFTNIEFNYVRFLQMAMCICLSIHCSGIRSLLSLFSILKFFFAFVIQLWTAYNNIAWAWWARWFTIYFLKLSYASTVSMSIKREIGFNGKAGTHHIPMSIVPPSTKCITFLCAKIHHFYVMQCNGCYRWILYITICSYLFIIFLSVDFFVAPNEINEMTAIRLQNLLQILSECETLIITKNWANGK